MKMGTSGGEPRTLLNALKPMLGTTGDIRTPDDVVRMISLMRDAEKLMSRCIYINILKATISQVQENQRSTATLDKFLSIGGWNILNKWLMEAKKAENYPVVIELLEVLKSLPVTIEFLKQGNTGKLVKHLTKLDNPEIKRMASDILKQWMILVRQTQPATSDKSKVNGASESVENNSDLLENSRYSKAGKVANSEPGVKAGKRSRESSAELSRSPQPEKKTKTLSEVKSNISSKQTSKTKLIPPQPKPVAMESTGFMNALASATVATPARKRKRTTAAKTSTTPNTTTTAANSTTATSTTKPAFTGILDEILSSQSQTHGLEDKEAEKEKQKDKEIKDSNNKDSSTPTGSPQPADSAPSGDASDFSNDNELESKAKDNSPENTPPASVDSTQSTSADDSSSQTGEQPNKKSKKGKRVTWAEDHKLTKFHYFDLDEEERIVVRHPVNFLDAAHNEMVRERQLVEQAKRLSEDRMCERISWYRPKVAAAVHERPDHEPGLKSEQYQIQKDRESSILADLYLSKSSLPDTPAEPDPVVNKEPEGEPKIIPHDEKGTTHLPIKSGPQETQPPPQSTSGVQLPPALASLFSGGAGAGLWALHCVHQDR